VSQSHFIVLTTVIFTRVGDQPMAFVQQWEIPVILRVLKIGKGSYPDSTINDTFVQGTLTKNRA
jgi:hypothetical protein